MNGIGLSNAGGSSTYAVEVDPDYLDVTDRYAPSALTVAHDSPIHRVRSASPSLKTTPHNQNIKHHDLFGSAPSVASSSNGASTSKGVLADAMFNSNRKEDSFDSHYDSHDHNVGSSYAQHKSSSSSRVSSQSHSKNGDSNDSQGRGSSLRDSVGNVNVGIAMGRSGLGRTSSGLYTLLVLLLAPLLTDWKEFAI